MNLQFLFLRAPIYDLNATVFLFTTSSFDAKALIIYGSTIMFSLIVGYLLASLKINLYKEKIVKLEEELAKSNADMVALTRENISLTKMLLLVRAGLETTESGYTGMPL